MIHYHGAPLSGPRDSAERFYRSRHILVSFAYPDHLPLVADVAASFVLDNGAFTTWKSGKAFDFDGYSRLVEAWHRHPGFDWALAPDVIDGDEEANNNLLMRFVHRFGLRPWIVPVWHFHEDVRRLRYLCGAYHRVALGSSGEWPTPGTESWWERVDELMPAITLGGSPMCRLHGLRMLNPDVFTRIPLGSADSTNATVNCGAVSRFGMYPSPEAWQRAGVIADRIESYNSSPTWVRIEQTERSLFHEEAVCRQK